ncbi:MAG: hypothetical protein M3Q39_10035 [Actinomycetota bacterium]|nr:hypothetical protein [Actinomycetota bacterium]
MITPSGERLTVVHRASQVRLAAGTVLSVRRRYTGIDRTNRQSFANFADLAISDIRRDRARSRALAGRYWANLVALEATPEDVGQPEEDPDLRNRLYSSIYYQGRAGYDNRIAGGQTPEESDSKVRVALLGSVVRHVLDGSREDLRERTIRSRQATGFVRVTAGDDRVCYFCAMLASRTDYKERSFDKSDPRFAVGGNPMANAKVHDSCRCSLRPIFDDDVPDMTLNYQQLWRDLSGDTTESAVKTFRSGYNAMVSSSQM